MDDYSDISRLLELIRSVTPPGASGQTPGRTVTGTFARDVIAVPSLGSLVFALDGDDIVNGSASADAVAAGAGDDMVRGGAGDDTLLGGLGDDTLYSQAGRALIEGGDGDDRAIGDIRADLMNGDAGDDFLRGFAGNDTLNGGLGNDVVAGDEGDDSLTGGAGNDTILMGIGSDRAAGGDGDDRAYGGDGADSMTGDDGADTLVGGIGADTADGGAGDDVVRGEGGDDRLLGGTGNDVIVGGDGNDFINAGTGNDRTYAGAGDDTIAGSFGSDRVDGGLGNDTLTLLGDAADYRFETVSGFVRIAALDGSESYLVSDVETVLDADGDTVDTAGGTTLQLLHASDFEGNTDAIGKAANFATLVDFFDDQFATTLFLSSGDNFIPSPFASAQSSTTIPAVQEALEAVLNEVMSELTGLTYSNLETERFRADVAILNAMGLDASVIGNHDFDLNQQGLLNAFGEVAGGVPGTADDAWLGALWPYLSANMRFGPESILDPFVVDGIEVGEDATGVIAPYTILEQNGEQFGYIGVTTQILESISSTLGDPTNPNDDVTVRGDDNDMAALAALIQPIVDQITDQGVDKIILGSHLQQIRFEQELATLLTGVDIMIGGGSDAIFADAGDRLRAGDAAAADYPQVIMNAAGEDVLLVNTDGQYNYVGRLVVQFDADGNVIASSVDADLSGAYATDDQGVTDVTGAATAADAIAASQRGGWVKQITDAISAAILQTSGTNFFADQAVDLNGARNPGVRTEETNLGNLTADANLSYANDLVDEPVLVSIKNGGGIRADILNDDGLISELDISTALAFNNDLSLVTVTTDQLLEVLNHGVSASVFNPDGSAPLGTEQGRFPQIGGVRFSFDPDLSAGARVQDVWVVNAAGDEVKIFEDGIATTDAAEFGAGIRVVTLSFLLNGGDSYPFNTFIAADPGFADVVSLFDDTNIAVGAAQFENVGTEQDALAEYLAEFFPVDADPDNDFAIADVPAVEDLRIQNLGVPGVVDTDVL